MATLSLTKTYDNLAVLDAVDLSNWLDDLETFINSTKLSDDNIQNSGITASTALADASISTSLLANSAATTATIADSAITTAKINDLAVTTAKIDDADVTTAKIAASGVTTAKLNDLAVTTAKIATGAVTLAKRAALGQQLGASSSGNYQLSTTSTNSITAVTNLSTTITLVGGRPVFVGIQSASADATEPSMLGLHEGNTSSELGLEGQDMTVYFYAGANLIYYTSITTYHDITNSTISYSDGNWIPSFFLPSCHIIYGLSPPASLPAAGSVTYSVKVSNSLTGTSLTFRNLKLIAYEL